MHNDKITIIVMHLRGHKFDHIINFSKHYSMKKLLSILFSVFLLVAISACGGSSSSESSHGNHYESSDGDHYRESSSRGYSLSLNYPQAVTAFLSNQTFKDENGNSISFGSSASNVSINGNPIGRAITVDECGGVEDGAPYAIFSFSTPYGRSTFFLTELDEDYGGRVPSKYVIFDLEDTETLYYKLR